MTSQGRISSIEGRRNVTLRPNQSSADYARDRARLISDPELRAAARHEASEGTDA